MNAPKPLCVSAPTMTSLELVQFINNQRDVGASELAHSDFLKKVPQVLGKDAGNFSSIYLDSMNREKPCYRFPKREACLMAMSYSYDLQAKVFDRMTALEAQAAAPVMVLPQNYIQALESLLASKKSEQLAIAERDHAIATKAQIGSRREATAMAMASVARRETTRLKARMGEAAQRASVIAVEGKTKRRNFYSWRLLKNYCTANELDVGKSFNPGIQKDVNTYPAAAWFDVYGVVLGELFGGELALTVPGAGVAA